LNLLIYVMFGEKDFRFLIANTKKPPDSLIVVAAKAALITVPESDDGDRPGDDKCSSPKGRNRA
jgi:hypothetical protein